MQPCFVPQPAPLLKTFMMLLYIVFKLERSGDHSKYSEDWYRFYQNLSNSLNRTELILWDKMPLHRRSKIFNLQNRYTAAIFGEPKEFLFTENKSVQSKANNLHDASGTRCFNCWENSISWKENIYIIPGQRKLFV